MLKDVDKILGKLKSKHDDDVVDRMNYLYTSWVLIISALLVLAKQYVGESLQCWVPQHFPRPWEQYIESYCFVENTYYFPVHYMNKTTHEQRQEAMVPYYQWVPFFLLGMMFVFLVPRKIWRFLNWRSGFTITKLVEDSRIIKKLDKSPLRFLDENIRKEEKKDFAKAVERAQVPDRITKYIYANVFKGRYLNANAYFGFWRQRLATSYVTNCYILHKVLNLANSLFQLYALNAFLGHQYAFWGFGVLSDLLNGRQWQASGHFPRVTFCDISQKVNFGDNLHTVQCVLMLNLFNEKIFIVLWFWLLILSTFNVLNLVYWVATSYTPFFANGIVKQYLAYTKLFHYKGRFPENEHFETYNDEQLTKFVWKFLRADGLTVVRLISDNDGDAVAAKIVRELWDLHALPEEQLLNDLGFIRGTKNDEECPAKKREHLTVDNPVFEPHSDKGSDTLKKQAL